MTRHKLVIAIFAMSIAVVFLCIFYDFFSQIFFMVTENLSIRFDPHNYNVQYHDKDEDIETNSSSGSWVLKNGHVEFVSWSRMPSIVTYKKQGMYGKGNYIPSYTDSVYLSSTTKQRQFFK